MNHFEKHKLAIGVLVVGGALILGSLAEHVQLPDMAAQRGAEATAAASALPAPHAAPAAHPAVPAGKVNINTASEEALETLSGIGSSKAQAIIAYRQASGPFYTIEDIMKVKGIGPSMFGKIQADITVGDITPPPQVATAKSTEVQRSARIFISTVMPGMKGKANDEYIVLTNPEDFAADLTGWSLKKRSGTGAFTTLVSAAHFQGIVIAPGGHLLLANASGYVGTTTPDILWPASYALSPTNNSLALFDSVGAQVDLVQWSSIPMGTICMRIAQNTPCE